MTQQMAGMNLNGPPTGQQFPPPMNAGPPKQMPPMGFPGQSSGPGANPSQPQMTAQQVNQQKMGQGPPPVVGQGQGMANNNFTPATPPMPSNYNNNLPTSGPPPQQQARPPTVTNGTHSPMGMPPVSNQAPQANMNQNFPGQGAPPPAMMGKPPMPGSQHLEKVFKNLINA